MIIKIKRLIALYIDFLIAFTIIYLPMYIIDDVFKDIMIIIIVSTILFLIVFFYLMVYKDLLFRNSSLGKKIMNLKIYINNEIPDKKMLVERNKTSFTLFPLYIFQILISNKSYGDIKYNTEVR